MRFLLLTPISFHPSLNPQSPSTPNLEFSFSMRVRVCWTYILLSLDWAPPAIFWVRRDTSSCLRSSSCFWRSSLFLPQSCWLLTLPDDCQIHPSALPPASRITRAVGFTIVKDCRSAGSLVVVESRRVTRDQPLWREVQEFSKLVRARQD
jgi:hypothetical protein